MKTTIQLLAASLGILALASCTTYVDPDGVGATQSTTTTTTSDPHLLGETTTRETTTTTRY